MVVFEVYPWHQVQVHIRFWYWALPTCPCKPSVAGCSASRVFHLLNNFTLASSIFATFSTRYNIQTNSSASWILRVVMSSSPMCWSSLCSLTNTPHGFHGVHCSAGALGIFSCLKSPTPGTTIICHQLLGQSVIGKVEVKVSVYCKEQSENHSSSVAVILFCHRLSSWYRLSTRYTTSFH